MGRVIPPAPPPPVSALPAPPKSPLVVLIARAPGGPSPRQTMAGPTRQAWALNRSKLRTPGETGASPSRSLSSR